jgi:FkbM family methyltransferase
MPPNSIPRRIVKQALAPFIATRPYRIVQALAMGWDIRSGGWREPEMDLIEYVVRPGDVGIDIGANYGVYSYMLSRAVGASGRVYAFEPIPSTVESFRLIASTLRLSNVEIVAKGCGDQAGPVSFSLPIQENGAIIAGIVHMKGRADDRSGKERHARYERTTEVTCDVVRLDDFLPDLEKVSFLKCDIEGADYYALRGARRTIERNHPLIVCEINPWFLEGFGLKVATLVGYLDDLGYDCYRYQGGRLIPTPVEKIEEDNWVFVHREQRTRVAALL